MASVVIIDNHTADVYNDDELVSRFNHLQHISIQRNNIIIMCMKNGDFLIVYGNVVNRSNRTNWLDKLRNAIRII